MMNLKEITMDDENQSQPRTFSRRIRYWSIITASLFLGIVGGWLLFDSAYQAGMAIGAAEGPGKTIAAIGIERITAFSVAAIWVFGGGYLSIKYHRHIDEQEENAVLWGALYGWYSMMFITPTWYLFTLADITTDVDAMIVMIISMIVTSIVWAWKKFR
jgi:hypothetical protein